MTSGKRLREIRTSLGLTVQDLADRANCTPATIRSIESGRQPSLWLAYDIAKAVDQPVFAIWPELWDEYRRLYEMLRTEAAKAGLLPPANKEEEANGAPA